MWRKWPGLTLRAGAADGLRLAVLRRDNDVEFVRKMQSLDCQMSTLKGNLGSEPEPMI